MWHRLAALWGCTIPEARTRCGTAQEFSEWCAFYAIEPWDMSRVDVGAAQICLMIASIFKDKGADPKLDDFIIKWGPQEKRSKKDIWKGLLAFADFHNSTVK